MSNRTLIQYFEWYLPLDISHWRRTAENAAYLASLGITDVWLPPAYKGHAGIRDVGYGVYDLYDLGEFYQKDTIPTKYGTRQEYLAAIDTLHQNGVRVLADTVLNHRMGADFCEETTANKMADKDRKRVVISNKKISAWTGFNFPGRMNKYSDFVWTKEHFSGVNWNQKTLSEHIFKLSGHLWSTKVDNENVNYDYLMGADVDFNVPEVCEELTKWGKWYLDTTKVDGFRLDAVKHISYAFFPQWLQAMRDHAGKDLFAVGEYWSADLGRLLAYMKNCGKCMSLFDVPLQNNFKQAGDGDNSFQLNKIFEGTLLEHYPDHAVTFVDNHDTQETQKLANWVAAWFKPLAYALILLREKGTPCVFYGDMEGIPYEHKNKVPELETLLLARKHYATGAQTDYFDHGNVIGWTREGGLAVLMSNGGEGWKDMAIGEPGQVFVDMLGKRSDEVTIGQDGKGRFWCNPRSVSVWVPKT